MKNKLRAVLLVLLGTIAVLLIACLVFFLTSIYLVPELSFPTLKPHREPLVILTIRPYLSKI